MTLETKEQMQNLPPRLTRMKDAKRLGKAIPDQTPKYNIA